MGFLDDIFTGIVGGGIKMLANQQQNEFQREQAAEQSRLNAIAQRQEMDFSGQQAAMGREFAASQQQESQTYNAQQADLARQFSAQQQLQAEGFSASQAELNRNFQERMSSTAYQRSRADMLAAGLNPILAAGAGGASTPAGSAASIGAVGGPAASSGALGGPVASARAIPGVAPSQHSLLSDVVTSAGELSRLQPTLDVLRQEADQKGSGAQLNRILATRADQETKTEAERTKSQAATTKNIEADTANKLREQGRVAGVNVPFWAEGAQRVGRSAMSDLQDTFSSWDAYLAKFGHSAVQAARGIWGSGTGGQ